MPRPWQNLITEDGVEYLNSISRAGQVVLSDYRVELASTVIQPGDRWRAAAANLLTEIDDDGTPLLKVNGGTLAQKPGTITLLRENGGTLPSTLLPGEVMALDSGRLLMGMSTGETKRIPNVDDLTALEDNINNSIGTALTNHINDFNNPHRVSYDQTGAYPITGGVLNGPMSTTGNVTSGSLNVNGAASITGNITGGSNVTAASNITATSGRILAGTYLQATTYIQAGTTITSGGNITSNSGSIRAAAGNVSASGSVSAGSTVSATTNITAGGSITATSNVTATNGRILAGTYVQAGSYMTAAGNIASTGGNVTANGALSAGTTVTSGGNITSTGGYVQASSQLRVNTPAGGTPTIRLIQNGTQLARIEGNSDNAALTISHGTLISCYNINGSGYIPIAASEFRENSQTIHKDNITAEDVDTHVDALKDLEIVTYDYEGQGTSMGVLVEKLEEVDDFFVSEDAEGNPTMVNLGSILFANTRWLQKLQDQVDKLAERE